MLTLYKFRLVKTLSRCLPKILITSSQISIDTLTNTQTEVHKLPAVPYPYSMTVQTPHSSINIYVPLVSSPHFSTLPFQCLFAPSQLPWHRFCGHFSRTEKLWPTFFCFFFPYTSDQGPITFNQLFSYHPQTPRARFRSFSLREVVVVTSARKTSRQRITMRNMYACVFSNASHRRNNRFPLFCRTLQIHKTGRKGKKMWISRVQLSQSEANAIH